MLNKDLNGQCDNEHPWVLMFFKLFFKDIGHLVRCLPLVLIRDLKSTKTYLNPLARLALKQSIKPVKSA